MSETLTPEETTQLNTLLAKRGEDTGKPKPAFWKVVVTDPSANGRVLFRSISETRAKTWIEKRVPRGYGIHLESPDGNCFHYMENRLDGEKGLEADEWQAYDPSEYVRPELNTPPGQDAWADTEG